MRLQFEVSEDTVRFLDSLTVTLGLNSRAATLRNALSLLDWAADEAGMGNRVGAYDESSKTLRELVLLPLRVLRANAENKDYMPAKSRELRKQAEELGDMAKDVVSKQKEQLSAAIEASKQAYQDEKAKAR